ncbi:DNA polymerase zeta, partial [Coelomomyces lativittatus]
MISQHPSWNARVVYGDTDSIFVQIKNGTKERAFQIGREIAEAVTKANSPPIKLNFEKVYLPCVLITKKRYIGYKFENEHDKTPIFDAKGIETVRRDGCPAVAKILKRSLEILFEKRDLSELKAYIQRQFVKILEHRVSPKDFIIAKEVKLGSYSDRTLPPPGAYLSLKRMEIDPRAEPSMRERVPYLIVYGAPGDRLIDQVRLVDDFLEQPNLFLNGQYYILHLIIPALQRIFELLSVDILAWYNEVKKTTKLVHYSDSQKALTKTATIDQYYKSCICGGKVLSDNLCHECLMDPLRRSGNFLMQMKHAEQ